jgi:LTXXQ motif family protein
MSRTGILPALLVLTLMACLASSAEARKSRSRHQHAHDYSARFGDDNRRPGHAQSRETRTEGRSPRADESAKAANATVGGGPFTAVIDGLVRACLQQAAQFQSWPFDDIARIAAPDDRQRGALEELRSAAAAAAEKLSADCPKEVSAPAWVRLDAVEQSVDAASSAFAAVEPALQSFYAVLDDEQKARLLRDLTPSNGQARVDGGPAEQREWRDRQRGKNEAAAGANRWSGICEGLVAALRGWPTSEIERGVRLSEPQRVAFYEFVTSSLKAAETLARACPADTALTPVGRMAVLRVRLAAVREATTAIHPALRRFSEALDQEQRIRFAITR